MATFQQHVLPCNTMLQSTDCIPRAGALNSITMAFQCIVLTPELQIIDQLIQQAIVPAQDGLVGLLTDRAPIVIRLSPGPLRIDTTDGQSHYYFVDGGLAQMKNDTLTILTQHAIPASEVDAAEAQRQYEEAMQITGTDPASLEKKQKAVEMANAKLAVAQKK